MRYLKFTIHEYRGVMDPIEIDVSKSSIIPIIGVNECGKTTILQAIYAFDFSNDKSNSGHHLRDPENLYTFMNGAPRVSATVSLSRSDLVEILTPNDGLLASLSLSLGAQEILTIEQVAECTSDEMARLNDEQRQLIARSQDLQFIQRHAASEFKVTITRNLKTLKYELQSDDHSFRWQNFAQEIVAWSDYILYFDDFRHDIPAVIKLDEPNEWKSIADELFKRADANLSTDSLRGMDARRCKTALSKVENYLNNALTQEWERFHLEKRRALSIHITYSAGTHDLRFGIAEKQHTGEEVFFEIKDRSKGFYWFFNFVMRLEFNPRVVTNGKTIYLLDEPGSYLHARAQDRLCLKLKELSRNNIVLYCTHSHYLLSPKTIPINSIRIVDKEDSGRIRLRSLDEHPAELTKHSAFQPILEALQVKPSILDYGTNKILITEGIYDFFCFDMMKPSDICVIPGTSADSLKYHISLMMAWRSDYFVLWDNDSEGKLKHKEASNYFGDSESRTHFRLLPLRGAGRKRILQDLFSSADLEMLKQELALNKNAGFKKVIVALYYSERREDLKKRFSGTTVSNFDEVFQSLWTN